MVNLTEISSQTRVLLREVEPARLADQPTTGLNSSRPFSSPQDLEPVLVEGVLPIWVPLQRPPGQCQHRADILDTVDALAHIPAPNTALGRTGTVQVPGRSSVSKFLTEIVSTAGNFVGVVNVEPVNFSDNFYVIGLRFTGVAFTTIPAN
jgi:hypothetical protein